MDGWGDGREAKEGLVHENDQGLASVESMISLSSTPNLSFSLLFISVGFFFFSSCSLPLGKQSLAQKM